MQENTAATQINSAQVHTALVDEFEPAISPVSNPAIHLDFIDGFRGLACLLVLLYHVWEGAHLPAARWWNPLFSGYTGVGLFFVLSGFCLYWPLVRPDRAAAEPTLLAFARRRAHRLLPPYYIALVLSTVAALVWHAQGKVWLAGPSGGPQVILTTAVWHLLLLQNLRPEHIFTLNGPVWSIALEASFYVAMPVLIVLARWRGIGTAVAFAALVTLSYRIAVDRLVGGSAGWNTESAENNFVLVHFLPGQWLGFALGMGTASLVSRGLFQGRHLPLGLGGLAVLSLAAWLTEHFTRYNPFSDSLYGLGYCLLILTAAQPIRAGALRHGLFETAIRGRSLGWIGRISYSICLVHLPMLKAAHAAFPLPYERDREAFAMNLLLLIPILAVSYLFHLAFEKPFLNRRKLSPLPQSQPAAQAMP